MRKILIVFILLSSAYAQTNAELRQQLSDLQRRMDAMENKNSKKSGLKVKDFGGETTNSPTNSLNHHKGSNSQVPEAKMKEILDSLKKGNSYMKERDQFLKDLEDEN